MVTTVAAAVVGVAGVFGGIGLITVLGTDDLLAAVVVTDDGVSIDSGTGADDSGADDTGSDGTGSDDAGSDDAGSDEGGTALLSGSDSATLMEDRDAEDRDAEDRAADLAESADCDLA